MKLQRRMLAEVRGSKTGGERVGVNPTLAEQARSKQTNQRSDRGYPGHRSSRGRLEPSPHVLALLLSWLLSLLRIHLSGCADPPAQSLHHHIAAFSAASELPERLGREWRGRLLASDVVPGHQVARERL